MADHLCTGTRRSPERTDYRRVTLWAGGYTAILSGSRLTTSHSCWSGLPAGELATHWLDSEAELTLETAGDPGLDAGRDGAPVEVGSSAPLPSTTVLLRHDYVTMRSGARRFGDSCPVCTEARPDAAPSGVMAKAGRSGVDR